PPARPAGATPPVGWAAGAPTRASGPGESIITPTTRSRLGWPSGPKGESRRAGVSETGRVRAWVPFADVVARLTDTVAVDVYDGETAPPASLAEVEFYVLPYTFAREPLRLLRDMPRLRVAQTLTAGYEHVLPYLPAGVTLCNA